MGNLFDKSFLVLMLLVAIIMFFASALMVVFLFDSLTLEEVGVESIPCIDKLGNPFENELCEDTIYCSRLGVAAEMKCSERRNLNQEGTDGS